jgi:hypothetical protein
LLGSTFGGTRADNFLGDFTHWPDKSAVRIKIIIPTADRRLVRWSSWGRKRCDPDLFEYLNQNRGQRDDGRNQATWFIYLGVIEPNRFASVEAYGKSYMQLAA